MEFVTMFNQVSSQASHIYKTTQYLLSPHPSFQWTRHVLFGPKSQENAINIGHPKWVS